MLANAHALVLNTSFQPLRVVSWQKAVQLLFQGKVEVLEQSDAIIHTVSISIRVPAVLRLLSYISLPYRIQSVRFSRVNVFVRDNYHCQYCGKKYPRSTLTLDHVIPVVQGGKKSWDNIVTCCKSCNQKKGGLTPEQARMRLVRKPRHPSWLHNPAIHLGISVFPDSWKVYLKIEKG